MNALTRAIAKWLRNFCCSVEGSRSPDENIELERLIPMQIWMDFDHINSPKYKAVKFHADIQGCQSDDAVYFNGQLLTNSNKVTISCNSFEHSIKIQDVDLNDIGVYVCQCRHKNAVAITYGTLNVAPDLGYHHDGSYTLSSRLERNTLRVSMQLVSVRTYAGKEFSLVAQFRSPWLDGTIYWFKNNKLLSQNEHIKLLRSTLQIKSAVPEDSGVYHCVYKTQRGTVSSVCDVIVINNLNLEIIINPTIGCHSKPNIIVNIGDDIRFIIKSKVSMTASGHWYFGNKRLKESRRVYYDDYGEGFIGLRILGATGTDQGRYFLVQADLWSDYTYRVEFFVTVIDPVCNYGLLCNRVRHMLPMVACLGARCIFDAEFSTDSTEFFVQWIVGRNLVRSDDTRFKMISLRDTHALLIKCVDQSMNGEVVCELRAINDREIVAPLIKKTTAYLTLVPPDYVKALRSNNCLVNTNRKMVHLEPLDLYPSKDSSGRVQRVFYDAYISHMNAQVVLKFYMMRLEDGYFYCKVLYHMDILDKDIQVTLKKLQITKSRKAYCFELYWGDKTEPPYYYTAHLAIEGERFWRRDCTSSTELSTAPYVRVEDVKLNEFILCYVRKTHRYPMDDRKVVKSLSVRFPDKPLVTKARLMESYILHTQYNFLGKRIGSGSFASAQLVERLFDGEILVAKCAHNKAQCNEHIVKEYLLLKVLNHANIIQPYALIKDGRSYVLLMEYMRGGSLAKRLRANKKFSENETKMYIQEICRGLAYLHFINIVHLDIKPDNIMCINPSTNKAKLIDFGLAKIVTKNGKGIPAGTFPYIAPELLHRNELSIKCDMYSVGVTTYQLLTGKLPYKTKFNCGKCMCENFLLDTNYLKYISNAGVMFIKGCLEKDPTKRLSAKDALAHQWFRRNEQKSSKTTRLLKQLWATDGSLVQYQEAPMVLDLKFNNEKIKPRRVSSPIESPISSSSISKINSVESKYGTFSEQVDSTPRQLIEDEQEKQSLEQDFRGLTLKTYEPQDNPYPQETYKPPNNPYSQETFEPQDNPYPQEIYESQDSPFPQEIHGPQDYCRPGQETYEPQDYCRHRQETYEPQESPYPQEICKPQDSPYPPEIFDSQDRPCPQEMNEPQDSLYSKEIQGPQEGPYPQETYEPQGHSCNGQPQINKLKDYNRQGQKTYEPQDSLYSKEIHGPQEIPYPQETSKPQDSPCPEGTYVRQDSPYPQEIFDPQDCPYPQEINNPQDSLFSKEIHGPQESPYPQEPYEPQGHSCNEQPQINKLKDYNQQGQKTYETQNSLYSKVIHGPQESPYPQETYGPQGHSCNGQPQMYKPQDYDRHGQKAYEPQDYCRYRQETYEPQDYCRYRQETYEPQDSPYPQETYKPQDSPYLQGTYVRQDSPYPQEIFDPQDCPYPQEIHGPQDSPYPQETYETQGHSCNGQPQMYKPQDYDRHGQKAYEPQDYCRYRQETYEPQDYCRHRQKTYEPQDSPYPQETYKPQDSPYLQGTYVRQDSPYPQEIFDPQDCPYPQEIHGPQESPYPQETYEPQGHSCNGQLQMHKLQDYNRHGQKTHEPQDYCCHRQETYEPRDYCRHRQEAYEPQDSPYPQETYKPEDRPYLQGTYVRQDSPYPQEIFDPQDCPYPQEIHGPQESPYPQKTYGPQGHSCNGQPQMHKVQDYNRHGQKTYEPQDYCRHKQKTYKPQDSPYPQETYKSQDSPYPQEIFDPEDCPYLQEKYETQGHSCNGQPQMYKPQDYNRHGQKTYEPQDFCRHRQETYEPQDSPYPQETYVRQDSPYPQEIYGPQESLYPQETYVRQDSPYPQETYEPVPGTSTDLPRWRKSRNANGESPTYYKFN